MFSLRKFLAVLALGAGTAVAQNQSANDWTKIDAAQGGFSEQKLHAMSAAIRTDPFKKIGSVLIARHGKLVYEDYVDGDAGTPRDTRSATKTITGALVGIAIANKKR